LKRLAHGEGIAKSHRAGGCISFAVIHDLQIVPSEPNCPLFKAFLKEMLQPSLIRVNVGPFYILGR
jgi:hypothetical protein